jgi:hypothetical protein
LRKNEKDFWDFQRRELARLGYSISKAKITKHALEQVFDFALNPLDAFKKIVRKVH